MNSMKEIFVVLFMISGLFFFFVGTVGVIRFPDALTRAHGAAKCDTLGAVLCLISLMIYNGSLVSDIKIFLVIVFVWVTNPTSTHMIAKAIVNGEGRERE